MVLRFRLGTFFVTVLVVCIASGWLILRWQREQAIQGRLAEFDRMKAAAESFESQIKGWILSNPIILELLANSPTPPENKISGGVGSTNPTALETGE